MNDPEGFSFNESARRAHAADQAPPRAIGSPLPVGNSGRTPSLPTEDETQSFRTAPPPGRALTNPDPQQGSGLDRAMGILRMAIPFVQRILPLLDGNIGTAVSNILTPHPQPTPNAGSFSSRELARLTVNIGFLSLKNDVLRSERWAVSRRQAAERRHAIAWWRKPQECDHKITNRAAERRHREGESWPAPTRASPITSSSAPNFANPV